MTWTRASQAQRICEYCHDEHLQLVPFTVDHILPRGNEC